MDFSDILSYPSPSNNVIQQVTSSDLHTCQRYLTTCSRLVNILSDRDIDIRSVHYKYRIERFLNSRSKTSRKFIATYEQRFPELTIARKQLFIYESNGNVRIDCSHPATASENLPPINKLHSTSSSIVEENLSVPEKDSICLSQEKSVCWTIVKYVPRCSLLPSYRTPIRLPWIVKREKSLSVECDLRPLYNENKMYTCEPFDLRPLFIEKKKCTYEPFYLGSLFCVEQESAVECDTSPLFINNGYSITRDFNPPAILNDFGHGIFWNLLLLLIFVYIIITVACGIELSLLCYASVGVLIYIHYVVMISY